MPSWMSVEDAATALAVDSRQVRNLITSGALDAQRVGRAWLVDPASVRARRATPSYRGRPLSPGRAWQVLAVVDTGLRPDRAEAVRIPDRRVRYEVRRLLRSRMDLTSWEQWLRHRAEHRRYWFHPAAAAHLADDPRVVAADVTELLDVRTDDLIHHYLAAADLAAIVADHHGRALGPGDDSADSLELMAVPAVASTWRSHVHAAEIVGLTSHPDARVRQSALDRLAAALDLALADPDTLRP